MFLKKPASYTTRWLPQRPGYKLWRGTAIRKRRGASVKMMPPKYK